VGGVYGSVINLAAPGIRAGVDFTLAQGAQVSGRVTAAGSGTALPGVVVAAHDRASGKVVGLGRSGTDGSYSTSGLPVGTYQIVFAPDLSGDIALAGYQRATVDNVVVSGTNAVTGVNAQLVRDPSKIKYLPIVTRP
jgi:hypothetical protein